MARHANITRTTIEGKRVLLKTKNWKKTKDHLDGWLMATFSLGYHTRRDYIENVYVRLQSDPEVKDYLVV